MRYFTGIDGYFIIFMIRIELNIGKYENMVNMKYGILKWPDITRTLLAYFILVNIMDVNKYLLQI